MHAHHSSCWQKDFLEVVEGHHSGQQGPVRIGPLLFQESFYVVAFCAKCDYHQDKPRQPVLHHRLQRDQGYLESPQDQSRAQQQMDLTLVHFP